jgi:hypothetical protein
MPCITFREPMPKRTHAYQYSIRFNVEQLDLVSRLMARTGLSLVAVIRFALANLADKLGEPIKMPRAGAAKKTPSGASHEAAKPSIESGTTAADPELDVDF